MDRLPPSEEVLEHEELRELEFDFLEELMQEPPHGHNHGRAKINGVANPTDDWRALETDHRDAPSYKREPVRTPHGTRYAYQKLRCRCPVCKTWNRERLRRNRETTP